MLRSTDTSTRHVNPGQETSIATPEDIANLLKTYEQAMNASDPDLAASCWTTDGVLIPAMLPTAAGPAIHDTYAQTFAAVQRPRAHR